MSSKQTVERWEDEDRFPEDNISDTSSRDYPRLYLESDYGQRTDRENDLDTDLERAEKERERRINTRWLSEFLTEHFLFCLISDMTGMILHRDIDRSLK